MAILRAGKLPFNPKAGSRLYGYNSFQILSAIRNDVKLPDMKIKGTPKPNKKEGFKPDPKFKDIENLSKDQIKALLEKAQKFDYLNNKDSKEGARDEGTKFELTKLQREVQNKNRIIAEKDKSINRLRSSMSDNIIRQTVMEKLKGLNVIDIDYPLNDKRLMNCFKADPNDGSIAVLDGDGNDMGMSVGQKLEMYRDQEAPYLFKNSDGVSLGAAGNIKNKKGAMKDMTPMDKILSGIKDKK